MATRTVLTDDLDEKIDEDVRTVTFAHEGATFEIDLGARHRDELESALGKFLDKARPVNRRTTGTGTGGAARAARSRPVNSTGVDTDAVRAWARDNGHTVSDKGRIANTVLEAYRAANPGK